MEKEIMDILAQGAPIFARLVVAGIFALFACLVYPWLKEQKIYGQVVKFVRAAEKMAEAGKLDKAKKNAYVVALLEKAGVILCQLGGVLALFRLLLHPFFKARLGLAEV